MSNETMNDPWDTLEEPSTRTPRSLETRDTSQRKKSWQPPQLLPDPTPQDGYVFKWVRAVFDRNRDDKANYNKRLREGWEPVQVQDHPELMMEIGVTQTSGIVETGGLILCKMPAEFAEQRRRYYQDRTEQITEAAEEGYLRDDNEVMKKHVEKRRKVVFGR